MQLPKYNNSAKKGEDGQTIVRTIVETELNWIFRRNPLETDFGIDSYFDILNEQMEVTGKSIAVQLKSGASYFKKSNSEGWVYRGEIRHLNYYLNHGTPVLIV